MPKPKLYTKSEDGSRVFTGDEARINYHPVPDACRAIFIYACGKQETWQAKVFDAECCCLFYRDAGKYLQVVNTHKDLQKLGVKTVELISTYEIEVDA